MWVEPSFSMTDAAKNPTPKKVEIAPKLLLSQPFKIFENCCDDSLRAARRPAVKTAAHVK